MGELDEKLNAILGDPDAMGQIMALARSLGGEGQQEDRAKPPVQESGQEDVWSALGSVDPRMLQLGMRAIETFQKGDDKRTALLRALRPFVREERYEKLETAIRLTKLSQALRMVLDGLREGEEPVV